LIGGARQKLPQTGQGGKGNETHPAPDCIFVPASLDKYSVLLNHDTSTFLLTSITFPCCGVPEPELLGPAEALFAVEVGSSKRKASSSWMATPSFEGAMAVSQSTTTISASAHCEERYVN
jgi:hypothetical protein